MLKPYSTVEETSGEITYEFKTIYLWILYGIPIMGGIGLRIKNHWSVAGAAWQNGIGLGSVRIIRR